MLLQTRLEAKETEDAAEKISVTPQCCHSERLGISLSLVCSTAWSALHSTASISVHSTGSITGGLSANQLQFQLHTHTHSVSYATSLTLPQPHCPSVTPCASIPERHSLSVTLPQARNHVLENQMKQLRQSTAAALDDARKRVCDLEYHGQKKASKLEAKLQAAEGLHSLSACLSNYLSAPLSLSAPHTHSLSLVLVVMMKSKELKTKISHAHSLILSL